MKSVKFHYLSCQAAGEHPNCQHPQSDKTLRTCAAAVQSEQIIRRTTSVTNTDPMSTRNANQGISCLHVKKNKNNKATPKRKHNSNTIPFPLKSSAALEERIQLIIFIVCQRGHGKHTLPLVSSGIDSVCRNSLKPRPNLPHEEKI